MKKLAFLLFASLLSMPLIIACNDDVNDNPQAGPLRITTNTVTDITANTATSGGAITGGENETVRSRGICWSTERNPTTEDNMTTDGNGKGAFSSELTDLQPSTTYYVRAYAVTATRTVYGNQVSFITLTAGTGTTPTVTTTEVTDIRFTTAMSGGTVTDPGASEVTAAGVCWSTTENPTVEDIRSENTLEGGRFISLIDELEENTTYYLRAYAENETGVAYGAQVSFRTLQRGYDEAVSDLEGDILMPEMAGSGAAMFLGNDLLGQPTDYWGMFLWETGIIGDPDRYFYLEFSTAVTDHQNIPDGRYEIAAVKDLGVERTAEPGSIYQGDDWGCWYIADDGNENETARASAVGGTGFVDIERTSGSGEEADFTITVEFLDTHGNKITGNFNDTVLNMSAEGAGTGYVPFSQTRGGGAKAREVLKSYVMTRGR